MVLDVIRRLKTLGAAAARPVQAGDGKTGGVSPVAIDFGVGALKVLQVTTGAAPNLVAASCLETPEHLADKHNERLEFQLQALPRLVRQGGFKGKRAVCAIPAWATMCKHLQFARAEGVPVGALVGGAISTQLGIDASTLVYRHIEVGVGGGGKAEVICIAAARDLVDRFVRAMQGARLEPVGMHSEFIATVRAFDYINRRGEDFQRGTLFLDVGSHQTKVMIAHGTELVFARSVEVGGRALDRAAASRLGCPQAEARRRRMALDSGVHGIERGGRAPTAAGDERRAGGVAPGMSVEVGGLKAVPVAPEGAELGEPLEILTDEVRMCLRYHASQFPGKPVERAVFVGGEAAHMGLCQHIARAIRLPSQAADPLARVGRTGKEPCVGVDLSRAQPGWAVALGLCLSPTDL